MGLLILCLDNRDGAHSTRTCFQRDHNSLVQWLYSLVHAILRNFSIRELLFGRSVIYGPGSSQCSFIMPCGSVSCFIGNPAFEFALNPAKDFTMQSYRKFSQGNDNPDGISRLNELSASTMWPCSTGSNMSAHHQCSIPYETELSSTARIY